MLFGVTTRQFIKRPSQLSRFNPELFILEDRTHPGEVMGLSSLAVLGPAASLLDQWGVMKQEPKRLDLLEPTVAIATPTKELAIYSPNYLNDNTEHAENRAYSGIGRSDRIESGHPLEVFGLSLDLQPNFDVLGNLREFSNWPQQTDVGSVRHSTDEVLDTSGVVGTVVSTEQPPLFISPGGEATNATAVPGTVSSPGDEGDFLPPQIAFGGSGQGGGGTSGAGGSTGGGGVDGGGGGTGGNHAPYATDDGYITPAGATLNITANNGLLLNDGDIDGDPISAILVDPPSGGQVTNFTTTGSFSYTPAPGFVGIDSFTYKVNDGSLDSNVATVSIIVPSDNVLTVSSVGQVLESGTHGSFNISRSGTLTDPLVVKYSMGGTAVPGFDYYSCSGEVYFDSGVSTVSVDINPIDDSYAESAKTVILQVLDTDYYDLGSASSSSLQLIDDTNDTGSIITAVGSTVSESSTTPGSFTLSRSGDNSTALTINYTVDGSAKPGIDYGVLTGVVTFAAGSSTATIPVSTIDDNWKEGPETVAITLSQPFDNSDVYLDTTAPVTLTIQDDPSDTGWVLSITPIGDIQEGAGTQSAFVIHTSGGSSGSFSYQLHYKVDGSEVSSETLVTKVLKVGDADITILATPVDDNVASDSQKTVELQLLGSGYDIGVGGTTAEVGVIDDDTSLEVHFDERNPSFWHGGTRVRVCRHGNKASDIEVNYAFSGPTEYIMNRPNGKIQIPRGSGCVYIPIEPNDGPGQPVPPPNTPPIVITIGSGPGVSIPNPSDSILLPPFFPNPNPGPTVPNTGGGTTPVVVDVYATDNQATEGATPTDGGRFTFTRTGNVTSPLTVRYVVNPTGYASPYADPQGDISPTLTPYPAYNTITFPANSASVNFDYTATDDSIQEQAEQLVFKVIPGPGYQPGSHPIDQGTIVDNDSPSYSANFQVIDGEISTGVGLLKEGNITLNESLLLGGNVTADSENTPDASLVFNSRERDAIPIIQAKVQLNPNSPRPLYFKMLVTWDGQVQPERTITFPQESLINWNTVPITLSAPGAPVKVTGQYNYSVTLTAVYGNQPNVAKTWSSTAIIASKYHSNFGSGWSMGALDQLTTLANGDIVRQYGTGGWGLYKLQGNGTYLSPWGDYGTLQRLTNGAGQTTGYKHTLPSREVRVFNAQGYQTQWISADTLKTYTAEYDAATPEQLKKITWIDGSVITMNYSPWQIEGHRRIVSITTKMPNVNAGQAGATRNFTINYDQGDLVAQHTRFLRSIGRPSGGTRIILDNDMVLRDKVGSLETVYSQEPLAPGVVTGIQWGGSSSQSGYGIQPVAIAGMHEVYPGPVRAVYGMPSSSGMPPVQDKYVFTLDSVGRVLTRIAPDGGAWNYTYDDNGNLLASGDPLNRVTLYQYESQSGYVTNVTYPDSTTSQFFYKSLGTSPQRRVLDYTLDQRGLRTDYAYSTDVYAHLTRVVLPHDPGIPYTPYVTPAWNFAWTGGDISSISDPRYSTTTLTRDTAGRIVKVKDALNNVTQMTLNPYDDYTAVTDALNRTITTTYDLAHRPLTVQYPDPAPNNAAINGPVITMHYAIDGSGLNDYTKIDSANGSVPLRVTNSYDTRGLLVGTLEASDVHTAIPLPSRFLSYVYDARGNFVSTNDPSNPGTRHYDGVGRLDSITYRDAVPTEIVNFTYDQANQLTDTYDELNRHTQYEYNLRGFVKKVTQISSQSANLVSTYGYDAAGNPTDVTDGQNHTWSSRYDELGRVYETYDPLANKTSYFYDGASNLTQVRDAENHTTQFSYDPLNRPVYQIDANGSTMARAFTTHYNAIGQVDYSTDPDQHKTSYQYDVLGRPTTITEADDLPALRRSTTLAYTGYFQGSNSGNIVTVTDPLGRQTQSKADLLGRTLRVTYPAPDGQGGNPAPYEQYSYDAGDHVTSVTDWLGRSTDYTYYRNAVTTVTYPDPDGAGILPRPREYVKYTPAMEVKEAGYTDLSNNSNLFRTAYTYNDLGQLTQATEGYGTSLARNTGYHFDSLGRLDQVTDPRGIPTGFQYDGAYRQTGIILPDPDGTAGPQTTTTISYQYNKINQVSSVTLPDPDGAGGPLGNLTTQYEYDDLARVKKITDPRNSVTQLTYNWRDQTATVKDPLNNTTTWNYDALGRVTSEVNQLSASRGYTWDAGDRLTSMTDRRVWVTEYTYDNLDRVKTEKWHQGSAVSPVVNTITTNYNSAGLVSSVVDNQANLSYQYDALNRLTSESTAYIGSGLATLGTVYAFDSKGQRQSTAFTVGGATDRTENYGYDELGRLVWQNRTGNGAQVRVEQDYDAADRMTAQRRFANSAGTGTPAVTTLYSYDDRNRETGVTHRQGTATGTILQQFTYTFNPADWVTSETKTIGGTTNTDAYTYDPAGEIIAATHTDRATENFSWDANGNPTGAGYVIGTNNRLTEDPNYTYSYDAEGNRTSRTAKVGGATDTYTWDNRDRLTSSTASGSTVNQMYDPLDRRIGTSSGFTSSWFGYDGDQVMSVHQGGAITDRFTTGGIDDVIGQEKNGSLRWLLTDGRGSVTGTTSTSGSSTGSKTYGTFGGTQTQTGTTDSFFAYTGREWDDAVGLQYSRNRWYDPGAKRWISEDPIGFGGGDANLSRYVANSPGSFSDPSGLTAKSLAPVYTGGDFVGPIDERGQNNRIDDSNPTNELNDTSGDLRKLLNEIWRLDRLRAAGRISRDDARMLLLLINEVRNNSGLDKRTKLDPAHKSKSAFDEYTDAVFSGLRVSLTAGLNRGTKAVAGILTLGLYEPDDVITPRQEDLDDGSYAAADFHFGIAAAAAEWAAFGWLGKAAKAGSTFAKGLSAYGLLSSGVSGGKGIYDALKNGVNWGNSGQTALAAGNIALWAWFRFCFVAGTPVSTANGLKSIETLEVGEQVWSYDFELSQWKLRPIEETMKHWYEGDLVTINIQGEEITSTGDHPFWVIEGDGLANRPEPKHVRSIESNNSMTPGRWVDARDLKEADVFLRRGGKPGRVETLIVRQDSTWVYNLHVEGLSNFAVGLQQWLVHNRWGTGYHSKKLGQNMAENGSPRPSSSHQAGHIVPTSNFANSNRSDAIKKIVAMVQGKFDKYLPGLRDTIINGFWSLAGHLGTHTDNFIVEMGKAFKLVKSSQSAEEALNQLLRRIKSGEFVPKGKKNAG